MEVLNEQLELVAKALRHKHPVHESEFVIAHLEQEHSNLSHLQISLLRWGLFGAGSGRFILPNVLKYPWGNFHIPSPSH